MRQIYLAIWCILCLSSCSNNNLLTYYYPIQQQQKSVYYKFANSKYSTVREYIELRPNDKNQSMYFFRNNDKRRLYNVSEVKRIDGKIQLINYVDYKFKDTNMSIKRKASPIHESTVFKSDKKEAYSYVVEITNENGNFLLEKTRQFVDFQKITIGDKKYKTAKFKDTYIYTGIDNKNDSVIHQYSYFAKGIGMIKYEREFEKGNLIGLELIKILSQEEYKDEVRFNR